MILNSVRRAIFLVPHTHLKHDLRDVMQTWPGEAWCFEVMIFLSCSLLVPFAMEIPTAEVR